MLNFNFFNYFILTPFIVLFIFIWSLFIKNNFYYVRINPGSTDILKNSKFLKKINFSFFTENFNLNTVYYLLFIIFLKCDFSLYWFNHLKLNNFIINILFIIILISLTMLFLIKTYKSSNSNFSIDYFFSLFNLCVFIPLIYFSNTSYTFIFLLEISSILILYKFTVSKYFFKNSKNLNEKNKFTKNNPKYYINMLFFQYWVNFFSSVILFFSIFNVLMFFGTSEWTIVNLINKFNLNILYKNNFILIFFIYFIFIIGMFIKIGFTPSHLFKIEVYKGLPFISILFYTVFYFLSFFLFFIIITFYYFNNFKTYIWFFLFIFITLGLIYIITLLFDVNLIKAFFAYSTVINALTFILLLLVSLI